MIKKAYKNVLYCVAANVEIKRERVHRLAIVFYGIHFDPQCAPVKQKNVNLNKAIEKTGQIKFI